MKVAKPLPRLSSAVAMVGIQGSINQMTDIFEQSITTLKDKTTEAKKDAIKTMQTIDDGLSTNQKAKMVSIFAQNGSIANVYLVLTDIAVRHSWLQQILDGQGM